MIAAPIIVAYYVSWGIYARSYFVADIPGDKITHINYAFANISSDGVIVLGDSWADVEKAFPGDTWDQPVRGNFNQLLQLKQKYPQLRTLISVGGWVSSALGCSFYLRSVYLDMVREILWCSSNTKQSSPLCSIVCRFRSKVWLRRCRSWLVRQLL